MCPNARGLSGSLCFKTVEAYDLRKAILEEAHNRSFAIHPGSTKMY